MIAFFLHHRRQWKRESFDLSSQSSLSLSPSPPSSMETRSRSPPCRTLKNLRSLFSSLIKS
ncbi:unnamed protein product [Arabidopsis thaliana]|uniref:Uncharacterized protein n=2 Tax=Arabidopsis thaliana TaxID=3702 RepID=B3H6A4_ARATH|nr:uncharacterized protein AT5G65609 [Arabidopsis thaliana]AED98076.1 hypothetical protein AT5G65609 [Arabidopsis thaliana]VYS71510.1 unnamed protein product [Arabidopsis thaliana]|eukprot:NP_001318883.1 hypothetical protein AT5G65609 [Arabidopsis thaliana]